MFFKKSTGASWLIAFLGNPGNKYENTRHNAGFITADIFADKHGVRITKSKFKSLTATCDIGNEKILLIKPQTYMNLSGEAVGEAARFYKIEPDHIIVVSDEMSLPLGKIRVKSSGSAGGHNGLKNIIQHLNTEEFPRIRIGVGSPPHEDFDVKDWVLGQFTGKDLEEIKASATKAADAAEYYILNGSGKTMNKFN